MSEIRRRGSFLSPSPQPEAPNEQDIVEFTQDNHHFSMIRQLHMADYITMLNGFCGFMAIIQCMRFNETADTKYIVRAMWCVPLGFFFDVFDGRVARWRKKASLMGQELDSLADLVSFGVAPASIAFSIGAKTTVDTVLLTIFVLCGLSRLARFNVTVANIPKDKSGKSKYFEGTPIPTTLALVGLMAYWVSKGWIQEQLPLGVLLAGTPLEVHVATFIFTLSGSAMISKSLKLPKL
ncbi:CDP-diacylglycerol--serine O-phosphatidyltransferase [Yarrowia sp. B02]|nr:CDP-diacylglycerol--serine O-phosphatidyltransferase [Yarrowia sp. B02]